MVVINRLSGYVGAVNVSAPNTYTLCSFLPADLLCLEYFIIIPVVEKEYVILSRW
jgi:hypothetical protein